MKRIALAVLIWTSMSCHAALNEIRVTGECQKELPANQITFDLELTKLSKDVKKATEELSSRVNRLFKELKDRVRRFDKTLEWSTSNFSIREENDWQNGKKIFKGYLVSTVITVKMEKVDYVGEVLSLASVQGVQGIQNLRWGLTPDKMKEERAACLDEAIKDARSKAEQLAASSGVGLGKVLSIQESGLEGQPEPRPMLMKARMESVSSMPIATGKADYSYKVEVIFELK